MISNFAKFIEVKPGIWAAFNTLLMQILILSSEEYSSVISHQVEDNELTHALYDAGIYIESSVNDVQALTALKNVYYQNSGIIQLLYLVLTNDCNLRCRYCFLENNENCPKLRNSMSEEIAFLALDKFIAHLKKHNVPQAVLVLYGGEPTLEQTLLKKIVIYCRNSDIHFDITVITNGTTMTSELASFLTKHNVGIGLSIDGPKEITNLNRRFRHSEEGVYDVVWRSKNILDDSGSTYGLSMVVSEYFLEHQEEILNWLLKNHNKGIFYNLMHHDKPVGNWKEYSDKSVAFILSSYEFFEKNSSGVADGQIQRQIDSFMKRKFMFSCCGSIGANQITVTPTGDISICHGDSSDKKHYIGNIVTMDLEEFANTSEAQQWISRATINSEECLNCEALFCCGGGCRHHAEILFGSRNEIDKTYCIYAKAVFRWMLLRTLSTHT